MPLIRTSYGTIPGMTEYPESERNNFSASVISLISSLNVQLSSMIDTETDLVNVNTLLLTEKEPPLPLVETLATNASNIFNGFRSNAKEPSLSSRKTEHHINGDT